MTSIILTAVTLACLLASIAISHFIVDHRLVHCDRYLQEPEAMTRLGRWLAASGVLIVVGLLCAAGSITSAALA